MEEKRQSKRAYGHFNVCYRLFRKTEIVTDITRIKNISLGGTCIITTHQLGTGDILEISARMPPEFQKRIEVYARVLESKPSQKGTAFENRAQFLKIGAETRKLITISVELLSTIVE